MGKHPTDGQSAATAARGIRRLAAISLHTSPLAQPGTGDAGGMNVYVDQTARRLAARGVEVEIFTRATSSDQPPVAELAPGRAGPAHRGRAVRGPGQAGAARPAVLVRGRGDARRGPQRARPLRPRALALLALRVRSATWPRTAGGSRWCIPRTPWPRSRTPRWPTTTSRSRAAG